MEGVNDYTKLVGLATSYGAAKLRALLLLTSDLSSEDYLLFHTLFMRYSLGTLLPIVEELLVDKQSGKKTAGSESFQHY